MTLGVNDLEVGERIRLAREAAGLTQVALAQRVGLADPQSISNYERGRSYAPRDRLRKIAAATRKPIEWFVSEEPPGDGTVLEQVAAGVEEMLRSQELAFALLTEIRERLERLEGR